MNRFTKEIEQLEEVTSNHSLECRCEDCDSLKVLHAADECLTKWKGLLKRLKELE